jgi:hypothetical protein
MKPNWTGVAERKKMKPVQRQIFEAGRSRRVIALAAAAALVPAAAHAANRVTGLTVRNYTDYTAVIVKLQKPSLFKVSATKDGRLALVIENCAVSPSTAKLDKPVGVVTKITSATVKGRAYIYVTLGKGAKNYEGKALKTPPQIVFKI